MNNIFDIAGLQFDLSRFSAESVGYKPTNSDKAEKKLSHWLNGEKVNNTEDRAAMHMALRADKHSTLPQEFVTPALEQRARMKYFVDACDAETIVHIGVGGSDFGPRLVIDALSSNSKPLRDVRFLSTLTPEHIKSTLEGLDFNKTLFVYASKSFTTDETSFLQHIITKHYNVPTERFIVLTSAFDKAKDAGFNQNSIFPLWDWVGGRYSLWSSIGITIALVYGWDEFDQILAGARAIDNDLIAKQEESGIWDIARILQAERVVHNRAGLAILPYHEKLKLLPTHLQQLIMESNGKPCGKTAAPIVFGNTGTEFQHSFGQFLQQGPDITTSILITVHNDQSGEWEQRAQQKLLANAQAQADTLWQGRTHDDPHKNIDGMRPSLTISMPELDAFHLGALLALFEHLTVCDAFMMGINPFDQWGVEAGKITARELLNTT